MGRDKSNVIELRRNKKDTEFEDLFETYKDCKNEKNYCLEEKARWQLVLDAVYDTDPRGMWVPEIKVVIEKINEFTEALDWVIGIVDKKALRLFEAGK